MPAGAFVGVGLFLFIGLVSAGIAAWGMRQEARRVRTSSLAQGVIVFAPHPAFEGRFQAPAVEFTDGRGERIRSFTAFAPRARTRYKPGDVVRLTYQPDRPSEALIVGEMRKTWIWNITVGLIISAVATVMLIAMIL